MTSVYYLNVPHLSACVLGGSGNRIMINADLGEGMV